MCGKWARAWATPGPPPPHDSTLVWSEGFSRHGGSLGMGDLSKFRMYCCRVRPSTEWAYYKRLIVLNHCLNPCANNLPPYLSLLCTYLFICFPVSCTYNFFQEINRCGAQLRALILCDHDKKTPSYVPNSFIIAAQRSQRLTCTRLYVISCPSGFRVWCAGEYNMLFTRSRDWCVVGDYVLPTRSQRLTLSRIYVICCPLGLRGLCAVEYNMVPIRSQGMTCSKIWYAAHQF
jgi:hypothetical protein